MKFNKNSLKIDAGQVAEELARSVRKQIRDDLKKAGAVIGISGGLDSSVVVALCVKALGPERVVGIMMPEKDSSPDSKTLAQDLADRLGIKTVVENITPGLKGMECYRRRDEAIKRVFPEYDSTYKNKITIPTNILEKETFNFFNLTIESPSGEKKTKRMPPSAYLQIVAASNL